MLLCLVRPTMNLSSATPADFQKVSGFVPHVLSKKEHIQRLNHKGLVFYHALFYIKKFDPYAVETFEAPFSFPHLIEKFFKDNDALEETMERDFFNIRPDLLALDYPNAQIRFHEIEDTSSLRPAKLARYVKLFEYGDADDVDVQLFVYDRYGMHPRKIALNVLSIIIPPFA